MVRKVSGGDKTPPKKQNEPKKSEFKGHIYSQKPASSLKSFNAIDKIHQTYLQTIRKRGGAKLDKLPKETTQTNSFGTKFIKKNAA